MTGAELHPSDAKPNGFPLLAELEAQPTLTLADLAPKDGPTVKGPGDETAAPGSYCVGRFVVSDEGVYQIDANKDGEERKTWICGRLDIVARTRTQAGDSWGALLQWVDADGRSHEWAMSWALLAGDGQEIRRTLLGTYSR